MGTQNPTSRLPTSGRLLLRRQVDGTALRTTDMPHGYIHQPRRRRHKIRAKISDDGLELILGGRWCMDGDLRIGGENPTSNTTSFMMQKLSRTGTFPCYPPAAIPDQSVPD